MLNITELHQGKNGLQTARDIFLHLKQPKTHILW